MTDVDLLRVMRDDLVLVVSQSTEPTLFYSDGRVVRLDDIGYPPERTETIREFEYKGVNCGIYRLAPRQQLGIVTREEYDEGVRLFKEELIAAGHFERLLKVFNLEDNLMLWETILLAIPGIAFGYDKSRGALRLTKPTESKVRFNGTEYEFNTPAPQQACGFRDDIFVFGNVERTFIGTYNIEMGLRGTPLEAYVQLIDQIRTPPRHK